MSKRLALALPPLHTLPFLLRVLCVAVLLIAVSIAALAAPVGVAPGTARAFAGSYQLTDIVEDGGRFHVTMVLTLQNPGNKDVNGGIVAVFNASSGSGPHLALIGSFGAIRSLPHQGQVTISQTFTLSAVKYAAWQHGHAPVLEFLVPSVSSGGDTAIVEGIQAHQVPGPPQRAD